MSSSSEQSSDGRPVHCDIPHGVLRVRALPSGQVRVWDVQKKDTAAVLKAVDAVTAVVRSALLFCTPTRFP